MLRARELGRIGCGGRRLGGRGGGVAAGRGASAGRVGASGPAQGAGTLAGVVGIAMISKNPRALLLVLLGSAVESVAATVGASAPEVQAQLIAPLLRALLPLVPHSDTVQQLLSTVLAPPLAPQLRLI